MVGYRTDINPGMCFFVIHRQKLYVRGYRSHISFKFSPFFNCYIGLAVNGTDCMPDWVNWCWIDTGSIRMFRLLTNLITDRSRDGAIDFRMQCCMSLQISWTWVNHSSSRWHCESVAKCQQMISEQVDDGHEQLPGRLLHRVREKRPRINRILMLPQI